MNLRYRFLVGYGYLLALLLVTAISTAFAFHEVRSGFDQILGQNFETVRAATQMLETLERQDSATLAALLGQEGAREEVRSADERFEQHLAEAEELIADSISRDLLTSIRLSHREYREARAQLMQERPDRLLQAYEGDTTAHFRITKGHVYALLEANHGAMVEADQNAQAVAHRYSLWLGFIVLLALVSTGYLSRAMQQYFLDRLARMQHAASAIAAGDKSVRIRDSSNDELGVLAEQLNSALDRQFEMERKRHAMLNTQRQVLLGLLARSGRGTILLGLDGFQTAHLCSERTLEQLDDVVEWIQEEGRTLALRMDKLQPIVREFSSPGRPVLRCELLIANPGRPVGWIVETKPRKRRHEALKEAEVAHEAAERHRTVKPGSADDPKDPADSNDPNSSDGSP